MTQVKCSVINDMQDTPANRDRSASRLSGTIQVSLGEGREHLTRFCPHFFQPTQEIGYIIGLGGEFSITISAGRVPAYYFRDPEMLGAGDVDSQNRQRIHSVLVSRLDRAPIQHLWRQVSNQLADLPTQVFNSSQVILEFLKHLDLRNSKDRQIVLWLAAVPRRA